MQRIYHTLKSFLSFINYHKDDVYLQDIAKNKFLNTKATIIDTNGFWIKNKDLNTYVTAHDMYLYNKIDHYIIYVEGKNSKTDTITNLIVLVTDNLNNIKNVSKYLELKAFQ